MSYLARFTDTADEEGYVFVHDLRTKEEPRRQKPRSCAYINDLYQVIEKGLDPAIVEEFLADKRDGPGAAAITEVIANRAIPERGSLTYRDLMRFISFAGVRSPAFRSIVTTSWEPHADSVKQQNLFVSEMLKNAKRILPYLTARHWRLWISAKPFDEFITSDQPLGMHNPGNVTFDPGDALARREIIVFFALSPSIAIEGRGLKGCAGTDQADSGIVAAINGTIGSDAHRNVYSRSEGFAWANYGAKPIPEDRLEFVKAWRQRKGIVDHS